MHRHQSLDSQVMRDLIRLMGHCVDDSKQVVRFDRRYV